MTHIISMKTIIILIIMKDYDCGVKAVGTRVTEQSRAEQSHINIINTFLSDTSIGVRDAAGTLVGAGFLVGWGATRELSGLMVHPDHRRKGTGGAITARRVELADSKSVTYFVTEPWPTNTIHQRNIVLIMNMRMKQL
jgi:GNAT superfamily N-acetyltransferase